MSNDTLTVDLRTILDPRLQASDELKNWMRKSLQRQSAEVIELNSWLAQRTRRNFECQTQPRYGSPSDAA